jgi:cell division protein FtsB
MKKLVEKVKIKAKNLLGIAVWVLAILLLVSTVKNIRKVADINKAVQTEKDKVEKMKEENVQIAAQIAQTQGDAYIEKQIRDKLGLAKPGEAIVILPDASILRQLAPQIPVEENTLPDPNWKKWIKLFI